MFSRPCSAQHWGRPLPFCVCPWFSQPELALYQDSTSLLASSHDIQNFFQRWYLLNPLPMKFWFYQPKRNQRSLSWWDRMVKGNQFENFQFFDLILYNNCHEKMRYLVKYRTMWSNSRTDLYKKSQRKQIMLLIDRNHFIVCSGGHDKSCYEFMLVIYSQSRDGISGCAFFQLFSRFFVKCKRLKCTKASPNWTH